MNGFKFRAHWIKFRAHWISEHGIWISEHGIWISEHGIWISEHGILISEHGIWSSEHGIWSSEHWIMSAHKSGATLERNAKVPIKCWFYYVFLKVTSPIAWHLRQLSGVTLRAGGGGPPPASLPTPPEPLQLKTVWGKTHNTKNNS